MSRKKEKWNTYALIGFDHCLEDFERRLYNVGV
jgi:hypothetical protein